jgi:esterase/lipase superfamily enzyme
MRRSSTSRIIWQSKERLGEIDAAVEPYKSYAKEHNIDVVDLSDVRAHGDIHHDKFAESPIVVRLIGHQLATGQPVTDQEIHLGDRIGLVAAGLALGTGAAIDKVTTVRQ